MIRMLVEQRVVVAMLIALGVGTAGVHAYPIDRDNVYLQIVELRDPAAFLVLAYGYAALWFTTPFFVTTISSSPGVTRLIATTFPVFGEVLRLITPFPPRRCFRYSSSAGKQRPRGSGLSCWNPRAEGPGGFARLDRSS